MTATVEAGTTIPCPPTPGEPWSRAAERAVAAELTRRGYETELRSPRAHGGDIWVRRTDGWSIIEVRSVTTGPTPHFDVDRGLKVHRRLLASEHAQGGIVVVYVKVDTDAKTAVVTAERGEIFECLARRAADAWLNDPEATRERNRCFFPLDLDDLDNFDGVFPGGGR